MQVDLSQYWYRRSLHWLTIGLLPFSWLFGLGAALRRYAYQMGLLKTQHFSVPVIVVGNITVGGTGKTPFVIWLAQFLQSQGFNPGIVSRGVGGQRHIEPHMVKKNDTAYKVGDEAILIAQHTNCPFMIGIDRAKTVTKLLHQTNCNVIISDDGLQHYRLGRSLEIAMIDGIRGLGNQQLLPAGPLRERRQRLQQVDFIVVNDGESVYTMKLKLSQLVSVKHKHRINLQDFRQRKVHAMASIGHPERFFQALTQAGYEIIPHVFPDHYLYRQEDIKFHDHLPVFMTEKDAVKCIDFVDENYWFVSIDVEITENLKKDLLSKLL